jgi:hypothetical protein
MATPVSGPISMDDIDAAFGRGKNLAAYRGITWYRPGTLVTGTFPASGPLSIGDFYNKQGNDPAAAGSQTYNSGTNNFTVPLYRNSMTINIWGGGGAGGIYDRNGPYAAGGAETRVYFPNGNQMYASGGGGGQGAATDASGGVRYGAGGGGGGAGGGTTNIGGAAGGSGDNGYGGSSPNGGTTAGVTPYAAYNTTGTAGKSPGGGGSGFNFYAVRGSGAFDFYASSGGGGGGGFSQYVFSAGTFSGQVMTIVVGAGGSSSTSSGAGGRCTITWT